MLTYSRPRAIHQVLPSFSQRDAIGNEVSLMQSFLKDCGFQSEIFSRHSNRKDTCFSLEKINQYIDSSSVFIHHFAVGSEIPGLLAGLGARVWTRYHNITPHVFFYAKKDGNSRQMTMLGRKQIPLVSFQSEIIFADSFYNAKELAPWTKIPPTVIPIFRDYEALVRKKFISTLPMFGSKKRVLFVGRICPNKCQQDLIELLYLYKKIFKIEVQFVLLGNFYSQEFRDLIFNYTLKLGLTVGYELSDLDSVDVLIRGSVSDDEMIEWYQKASVFCSLSEHEGFGVPLVESMYFSLPVLAHSCTAVTETVGSGGMLVNKFDKSSLLQSLHAILWDDSLREKLKIAGRNRVKSLSLEHAKKMLTQMIDTFN